MLPSPYQLGAAFLGGWFLRDLFTLLHACLRQRRTGCWRVRLGTFFERSVIPCTLAALFLYATVLILAAIQSR